jgi:hypothetical protein
MYDNFTNTTKPMRGHGCVCSCIRRQHQNDIGEPSQYILRYSIHRNSSLAHCAAAETSFRRYNFQKSSINLTPLGFIHCCSISLLSRRKVLASLVRESRASGARAIHVDATHHEVGVRRSATYPARKKAVELGGE